MPDTKISNLGAISSGIAITDVLPIVNSGVTKKVTVASLHNAYGIYYTVYAGGGAPGSLAFGSTALTSDTAPTTSMNTAVGNLALAGVTTGTKNTALGHNAGGGMTDSIWNTAIGHAALSGNLTTNAIKNTVCGANSGISMTDGTLNTHIGYHTGVFATTGSSNTTVGVDALYTNTTGSSNTAVGYASFTLSDGISHCVGVGVSALYNNQGDDNTACGYHAGYANTTGTLNTFLGFGAGETSTATVTKSVCIGANSNVTASNTIVLGGTGANAVQVVVGGSAANANAILDLISTTKPFMPPRMTTAQRDLVASPTAGMVIYNSSTNKLNVYTTAWEAVTSA